MSIRVERAGFDPVQGFMYYVSFKPNLEIGVDDIQTHADVEAVVSLTEIGDLADLTFVVPNHLRSEQGLLFICGEGQGSYVEPHAFLAVPGSSGDTVLSIPGRLEIDLAGRIVGMALRWQPIAGASS